MPDENDVTLRLSPLHYLVFASLFQSKETSGPAMLELLNAILVHVGEEPIDEIIEIRSEYSLVAEGVGNKFGRLDVLVRARSGRIFDIEVQIEKDAMNDRGFFYGGRLMQDEVKAGVTYDKMPPARVINIVDFYVRHDHSHIVEPVVLAYENNPTEIATNVFKMYNIQLPAFRRNHKTLESVRGDTFFTWLYLLDKGYQNESEMEVLSTMSEGMENFAARYHIAINDPRLKRLYRMQQDAEREEATRLSVAVTKAENRQNREHAKVLKECGVDPAIISRATGLSPDEIAQL